MGIVVSIRDKKRSGRGHVHRLEKIKEELSEYYGIDLDYLMASEPVSSLTVDQFDELTERILAAVDDFCEENSKVTVHDVLYILENVKDIVRENSTEEDD
jgi:spore coat polysaccharide biosynthesis protein SpsF (cytidylyltransferase family)